MCNVCPGCLQKTIVNNLLVSPLVHGQPCEKQMIILEQLFALGDDAVLAFFPLGSLSLKMFELLSLAYTLVPLYSCY